MKRTTYLLLLATMWVSTVSFSYAQQPSPDPGRAADLAQLTNLRNQASQLIQVCVQEERLAQENAAQAQMNQQNAQLIGNNWGGALTAGMAGVQKGVAQEHARRAQDCRAQLNAIQQQMQIIRDSTFR